MSSAKQATERRLRSVWVYQSTRSKLGFRRQMPATPTVRGLPFIDTTPDYSVLDKLLIRVLTGDGLELEAARATLLQKMRAFGLDPLTDVRICVKQCER